MSLERVEELSANMDNALNVMLAHMVGKPPDEQITHLVGIVRKLWESHSKLVATMMVTGPGFDRLAASVKGLEMAVDDIRDKLKGK